MSCLARNLPGSGVFQGILILSTSVRQRSVQRLTHLDTPRLEGGGAAPPHHGNGIFRCHVNQAFAASHRHAATFDSFDLDHDCSPVRVQLTQGTSVEKNEPSDNWFRRGQEENQVRRQVGCARWIGGRCFTWKHRLPSRWTMFRKRLPSPAGLRRALRRQRRLALAPQNASEERVDRPERPPGGWWHGGWRRLGVPTALIVAVALHVLLYLAGALPASSSPAVPHCNRSAALM